MVERSRILSEGRLRGEVRRVLRLLERARRTRRRICLQLESEMDSKRWRTGSPGSVARLVRFRARTARRRFQRQDD